jgi:Family of unknown function (DUF6093)
MSISDLMTRTCTLLLREQSGEDGYGNEETEDTELQTVCEVQQAQRLEEPGEGEVSDVRWNGFFPVDPGQALSTGDAVRVTGIGVLELVGEPWVVRDPEEQIDSHVEASMRLVAGAEAGS